MNSRYSDAEDTIRPKRSLAARLAVPVLAFVAGVAAMGWVLANWSSAASFIGVKPPSDRLPVQSDVPQSVVSPLPQAAAAGPAVSQTQTDADLRRRIAVLEQRIGTIDNRTRQAAGDAGRAEGLLIAFAARRALDRGIGLGYLESLLRQRFGATQPQAVATIIAVSHQPITLQELQTELRRLGPDLVASPPAPGWWEGLRRELAGLIAIRKSGSPAALPSERLSRAEQRLEAGQVAVALAEVNRLPGRGKAATWFVAAKRYIGARDALDRLETAALLEPAKTTPIFQEPAKDP